MDVTTFMQAMSNPQAYIAQQFLGQMIKEHPDEWKQCQQMFQGKSRRQQIAELSKLYKSKGMDLNAVARQYGVSLA